MKRLNILLVAVGALAITSCKDDPSAAFTADKTEVEVGEVIKFTDNSAEAYNHVWDFGDGEWSTAINPTHVYYDEGMYNVTLQVNDKKGGTMTVSAPTTITVNDTVSAILDNEAKERENVIAMAVGDWEINSYTLVYNSIPQTVEPYGNIKATFMADGTILQTDNQGNKSIGYWDAINGSHMYLSFLLGVSGLYTIETLSSGDMELVFKYTDSSTPPNVTTYTIEFER